MRVAVAGRASAAEHATASLRTMIMEDELSPGHHVRQEALSDRLGVSRSPLREALRALESEGLVRHVPNQGYFVVRQGAKELRQVYLMRRLLETEVLRSLRAPDRATLAELRSREAEVRQALTSGNLAGVLPANRRFHFALFDLSPLSLVVAQVGRLWNLSGPYQATYVSQPAVRARIVTEHRAMLAAYRAHDVDRLVALADAHRSAAEESVLARIEARGPQVAE